MWLIFIKEVKTKINIAIVGILIKNYNPGRNKKRSLKSSSSGFKIQIKFVLLYYPLTNSIEDFLLLNISLLKLTAMFLGI